MAKRVKLYDGTVLVYPDDTPDSVMIESAQRETATRRSAEDQRIVRQKQKKLKSDSEQLEREQGNEGFVYGLAAKAFNSGFANANPTIKVALGTLLGEGVVKERARSGAAQQDAGKDEGFLDRSGSYLESGLNSLTGGQRQLAGTLTGSALLRRDARAQRQAAGTAVSGETTWDELKSNPSAGGLGSFVYGQGLRSAPSMAAALVPGGIYGVAASQTGNIAADRAENDGRTEVTIRDLLTAAPAGIASAALEKTGIDKIFKPGAKTVLGRIGKAALFEGITEGLQSPIEYAGGTLGTKKGFDGAEALDQAFAGAVGGAGMGGGVRGGIELGGLGTRAVARGKREQAVAPAPITEQDSASPIPTDMIAKGRASMAGAEAKGQADAITASLELPKTNSRVRVTLPGGQVKNGVLSDAFDEADGDQQIRGIVMDFDDGTRVRANIDDLRDANVSIEEISEADAIDDGLRNAAMQALKSKPSRPVGITTPATIKQSLPVGSPVPVSGTSAAALAGPATPNMGAALDDYMAFTKQRESGGKVNAKNPKSSAGGLYQFTDGTFVDTYRKVYGQGLSSQQILAQKFDPKTQEVLMRRLSADNANALRGAGLPLNRGTLYLAHFAGARTAIKVLKADAATAAGQIFTRGQMSANGFLNGMTAGDVVRWASGGKKGKKGKDGSVGAAPAAAAVAPTTIAPADIEFTKADFGQAPQVQNNARQDASAPENSVNWRERAREAVRIAAEDKDDIAVTPKGTQVGVRYGVVEMASLTASNDADGRVNPAYPARLQPRDRSRAVSQAQVSSIAQNLNPRLLGRSPKVADGTPIIAPDGVVESGNGRVAALTQAYASGGDGIESYKQMISDEGFDISGFEQPALVRLRTADLNDDEVMAYTREANARDTLDMSSTEQAMADAQGISPNLMAMYTGGDVDLGRNMPYVTRFLSSAVASQNDLSDLIDSNGKLSQRGLARVRGAMLARGYGNSNLVTQAFESSDTDIKSILNALTDVSGTWAKMRDDAASGAIATDLDITDSINEAVQLVDRARRQGIKVGDLVGQRSIFTGDTVPAQTEAVLRLFFNRPDFTSPTSRARLAEALQLYADEALKTGENGGNALFDLPPVNATSILDIARVKAQKNGTPDTIPAEGPAPDGADTEGSAGVTIDLAGKNALALGRDVDGPTGESVPAQSGGPAEQDVAPIAPAKPAARSQPIPSNARISDNASGKSFTVEGASDSDLAAVAAQIPNAKPLQRKMADSTTGIVYSNKYREVVEKVLADRAAPSAETNDLTPSKLVRAVKEMMPRILSAQNNLASRLSDLPGWQNPGAKSEARIIEKVQRENYASVDALKDMVRGGFVVESMDQARRIEAAIADRFVVIEDKGWKTLSKTGYLDHKIVVRVDGILAELQIVPAKVWQVKKSEAEKLYQQFRSTDDLAERERLGQKQRALYATALEGSDFNALDNSGRTDSGNQPTEKTPRTKSASTSASGNVERNSAGESVDPSLPNKPGANPQFLDSDASVQTNATDGATSITARPSTSQNTGNESVSINNDIGGPDKEINNPRQPSPNRLVTDKRAAELRAKLREKLNRLNSGIDPEVLMLGAELTVYHVEKGARRFQAMASAIADDLGIAVRDLRKYLRGWYNGARDMMEDSGESVAGMDTADEVAKSMRTLDDWADAAPVVTTQGKPASQNDDGIFGSLFDRDAGPSTRDAAPAEKDGRTGKSPESQDARSVRSITTTDQRRTDAAERSGEGRAETARSGTDSDRNVDRVPAAGKSSRTITRNWSIAPGSLDEKRGPMQKARDNVQAIETIKAIIADGRSATTDEQAALAKYVGWGGLANIFPDQAGNYGKGFGDLGPRLRELLTDEEYTTARRSIQYAHYTSEKVVRPMWELAVRLGFTGGSVYEPGMGTGNFAGMMPANIAAQSSYLGIEYDRLTADIATALYPKWDVLQADYTKTERQVDAFDLVIGNPPFSATVVKADPYYGKFGFLLHDFFFAKSLDAVRPGGLLMFVTSAGTMNKVDASAREYLADRADLVGAIRLPSTAFSENAGTQVTTDIIVLRKRMVGEPAGDRTWTETATADLPNRDGEIVKSSVSRYFIDNPALVLGEQGMFDKLMAGERYAVRARPGENLQQALQTAMDTIRIDKPMQPLATPAVRAQDDVDYAVSERKEGSFYLGDGGKLMQLRGGAGRPVQLIGKGVVGGVAKAAQDKIVPLIGIRDALRLTLAADMQGDTVAADEARADLNSKYDAFVKKFGPINRTEVSYRRPNRLQAESARAKAREAAREIDAVWDEGSFDATGMLDRNVPLAEIAQARTAARDEAKASSQAWREGTFDPEEMDDIAIVKRPNIDAFMQDQEGYRLRSIEDYSEDTGEAKKGAIFFENPVARIEQPAISSPQDAMLYVMAMRGRPDLKEIAALSDVSVQEARTALREYLYRLPGTEIYESREAYLSGNVRDKLEAARKVAEAEPDIRHNVEALEAVQPTPLSKADIIVSLGMPWIPPRIIEQFGKQGLGLTSLNVRYEPLLAKWTVAGDQSSAAATSDWGTKDREAPLLIYDALNRLIPKINRDARDENGKKVRVLDAAATQAAQDKLSEIRAKFQEWVWSDDARTEQLEQIYNETFNTMVAPKFDGGYLKTPGISSKWQWRPHQSAVVARIIQTGNTYMAHGVGAGKTSAMIGAGMEMKRLGLVRKPMYAVPNHMLGQFTKEFYEQYPTARIMVADETRFHTSRRKQFVADVANADLDAVIITHSAFGLLPVSAEFETKLLQEEVDTLRNALGDVDNTQENRITRKNMEKQVEQLEQRQSALANRKKDNVYSFEETGVDFLFVDEAHMFRKLGFATKMGEVKGIDPNGSQASFGLYSKIRLLEDRRAGRSVVLASGTPITNTMAELFTVQRYLQGPLLKQYGIDRFDAWAGSFGDTDTRLEQDPAGGYKSVTRFSKFVNVPELSVMVRQFMDVVTGQELESLVVRPKLNGGKRKMIVAQQTEGQKRYQAVLLQRMKAIDARKGPPQKGDDIILSVINDGRKSAIDMRLINKALPKENTKLEMLIDNVFRIWTDSKRQPFHAIERDGYSINPVDFGPATQMVFADLGVNAGDNRISVHDYIRDTLVARGVPASDIALISAYKNAVQRQRLFNDMNDGRVRVLIGSVPKMGTGVNAQRRLLANHNLDPQWYPSSDEQRNGRVVRQGNMNPKVDIFDYSTKGTYDSTMWGMMETKGRFVEGFMRGDPTMRDMEDLGEASQYEQAKALTTSDPRMQVLTEKRQALAKALLRKSAHERAQATDRRKLADARADVEQTTKRIEVLKADIAQRKDISGDGFTATILGKTYDERAKFGEALLAEMDRIADEKTPGKKQVVIGQFAGFPLAIEAVTFAGEVTPFVIIERNGGAQSEFRKSESALGIVSSMSKTVRDFENAVEFNEQTRERAERTIEQFSGRGSEAFAGAGDIDRLAREVTDLESDISATPADAIDAGDIQQTDMNDPDVQESRQLVENGVQGDTINVADLRARIADLGIDQAIALRFVNGLGARVAGSFAPRPTLQDEQMMRGVISVAMRSNQDGMFTLNHESIHALRALRLFRPAEWTALSRRAQADAVLMRSVERRYPDLNSESRIEEAVADMFGKWAQERTSKGFVGKAFDRVLAFISAVRSWAQGNGWVSAEDVLRAIDAGVVGRREGTGRTTRSTAQDSRSDDDLFAAAAQPESSMTQRQRAELEARQKQSQSRRGGQVGLGDQEGGLFSSERDQGSLFSREAAAIDLIEALRGDGSSFKGKAAAAWDKWRVTFQDRYLPLFRAQQAIERALRRPLRQSENPYLAEELMTGRIGARMEQLADDYVDPLLAAIDKTGVSMDELETYLYARHAPERNAQIATINPEFSDGEGSGMTDIEAAAILARIERAGKIEAMEQLAAMVDRIRDMSLDARVETGLMSKDDVKAYKQTYKHYVPLRGRDEIDADMGAVSERVRRAGGITVKGAESKRAFGRRSKADSILAYTILQAEEAIVRGETNRVAQSFYKLAQKAPDPDFWQIEKVTRKAVLNPTTGLVRYEMQTRVQPEDADYTVTAKFGGDERRVTLNRENPAAARLADSMRNLTQQSMDWVVRYLGGVNRFLSAVNTSYNPEFVITNAFRDIQTATINMAGFDKEKLVAGTLKDYRAALVGSVRGAFKSDKGEWGKWYREFTMSGGRVFFNQVEDLDQIKGRLELAAGSSIGSKSIKARQLFNKVRDTIESANIGVENAIRLSAYKNAREAGMSKADAASLAKNVTVNFNRRGTAGPAMNAAYLFFNASVQGSTRLVTALQSKRVRKIVAGIAVTGALVEVLNAMLSDDDEDGESYYDKISAFDKSRNIILMMPGGKGEHIKIPMPYGYNVFWVMGQTGAEIARRGGDRAMESMGNLASAIVTAFNPIGGAESLLNFVSPTIVDPIIDLERNRDYADRPIMPEASPYGPAEPDAQQYFSSVGLHWRAITDALTALTGGDDVQGGAIDISPETLEHLSGVVMGASGAFIDRSVSSVGKVVSGEEVGANDIPFVRKLVAQKPSWYDKSAYYDRVNQVEKLISDAESYSERGDSASVARLVEENRAIATMEPVTKEAQKLMREIRKARGENEFLKEMDQIDDATYRANKTRVKEEETRIVSAFNRRWNESVVAAKGDTSLER
jgi:N12 class adenine-specific DNA methylase